MKFLFTSLLLLCIGSKIQSQTKTTFKTGNDVITAMHKAYAGDKWYKYFTFSQESHFYKDGKEEKMEVWHEAATFPGKLLIKFKTKDSKNGVLFANHMVYGFAEGKEMVARPGIHDLLIAAFDVYFLKPEVTAHLFDSLGYDLTKTREDIFNGRKVYVVGADKNDSTSNQFWIDAERMYLHRIIYKQGKGVNNCVFSNYQKIKGYWVAKTVSFKQDGVLAMIENYFDIKFPKELSGDLFDPKKFNEVKLD
jgi:hypothetical protein